MTETSSPDPRQHRRRNKWLVLIALYKFGQALLVAAIGFGALHLLHKDVGDMVTKLVAALRFNPESHFVSFVIDNTQLLDDKMLQRIGVVAFGYALLNLAEGTGLYLEKLWGEYLTLIITASFLPWELVSIFHRVTWVRLSLFTVNTLVLLYLLKLVVDHRRHVKAARRG